MPTKKQTPEKLKTRPDLTDDQAWLIWLSMQPENKGLFVQELYRKMLEWCRQKGQIPTRRRLLRWLDQTREEIPVTYEPAYMETPPAASADPVTTASEPCDICGKEICLQLHRAERG